MNNEIMSNPHIIKKTYPVLHMTCASCANSVESMLNSQDGVEQAAVNFASGTVNISFDDTKLKAARLQEVVQSIGYDLDIEDTELSSEKMEAQQAAKIKEVKIKTIGSIALSLPIVIIGMFFMSSDGHSSIPYANEIMWFLATPVVFWFGKDFFINTVKQAKHRQVNMDTLVALSTGVAYLFSVFNTLFPNYWLSRGLQPHVYFEAAAVIIAFILLGKYLEEKAKSSTSTAIKKLMGLQPKMVSVVIGNKHAMPTPIEKVRLGDVIQVKPGEKIALDGTVIEGSSNVDESAMSGEPIPIEKKEGDKVLAGTINQKGSFKFEVKKLSHDTLLSQIIRMVQDAQGSKAPVQKLVDKIASIFVPIVIGIALITFAVWYFAGGEHAFTQALLSMVTVLVIACPCALGLATPTAIMVGVGKGASNGILIKDAESLELAKKIDTMVLDKTGTITEGKPVVTDISWLNDNDDKKDILLGLEQQSEHPLAAAVVDHFSNISSASISSFNSITGKGASGKHDGQAYFIGNMKLMDENSIEINESLQNKSDAWKKEAKTVIWFADEKQAIAVLSIADEIKASSTEAIEALKALGIEIHMLTGDNEATASAIANKVGISHYRAEVLPQDKSEYIEQLQANGKTVAMVGDGINDSTALAQADVSIAMGKGSDIAMDVAKMTIISSDLNKIPAAIKLSKQTVATIRQNLFWAFIYNVIGIPIAAGVLYPINGFLLNPMIAGAAMAMSSVSVVTNSLRLKFKKV
ncbi:heavy metal translocating P-type ATPase [Fulvivirga sp.]|uniref:heavy metal translocating P-type ATPase n=2 Tax=Fulvivirga sp. TaxID=1931237 RepID=UPI0032EE5650